MCHCEYDSQETIGIALCAGMADRWRGNTGTGLFSYINYGIGRIDRCGESD